MDELHEFLKYHWRESDDFQVWPYRAEGQPTLSLGILRKLAQAVTQPERVVDPLDTHDDGSLTLLGRQQRDANARAFPLLSDPHKKKGKP